MDQCSRCGCELPCKCPDCRCPECRQSSGATSLASLRQAIAPPGAGYFETYDRLGDAKTGKVGIHIEARLDPSHGGAEVSSISVDGHPLHELCQQRLGYYQLATAKAAQLADALSKLQESHVKRCIKCGHRMPCKDKMCTCRECSRQEQEDGRG